MDGLKYGVLLAGIAGIVGCFLPLASAGGPSLFTIENAEMVHKIIVLGAFGLAALMALIGVLRPPILRWQGLLALVGFAVVVIKLRGGIIDMIKDGGIGARLIGIAPIAGALFAIMTMAIAAPAPRR